jgi:hypothetical protein
METVKLTYPKSLRGGTGVVHPEVEKITGLIPQDVDARAEYRAHVLEKYR